MGGGGGGRVRTSSVTLIFVQKSSRSKRLTFESSDRVSESDEGLLGVTLDTGPIFLDGWKEGARNTSGGWDANGTREFREKEKSYAENMAVGDERYT